MKRKGKESKKAEIQRCLVLLDSNTLMDNIFLVSYIVLPFAHT
jgi:hypothetical protein